MSNVTVTFWVFDPNVTVCSLYRCVRMTLHHTAIYPCGAVRYSMLRCDVAVWRVSELAASRRRESTEPRKFQIFLLRVGKKIRSKNKDSKGLYLYFWYLYLPTLLFGVCVCMWFIYICTYIYIYITYTHTLLALRTNTIFFLSLSRVHHGWAAHTYLYPYTCIDTDIYMHRYIYMHISLWLYIYIVIYIDTKIYTNNHGQCCRDWRLLCTYSIYIYIYDIHIYATAAHWPSSVHLTYVHVYTNVCLWLYIYVYVCVCLAGTCLQNNIWHIFPVYYECCSVLQRVAKRYLTYIFHALCPHSNAAGAI